MAIKTVAYQLKNSNTGEYIADADDISVTVDGVSTPLSDHIQGSAGGIDEFASPHTRKLMIGSTGDFNATATLNTSDADRNHWDDVFGLKVHGFRTSEKFTGELTLVKRVTKVNLPTNYYFFIDNDQLQPTIDGINIATSDLREYLGESRRLFPDFTATYSAVGDNSKQHTITALNDHPSLDFLSEKLNDDLHIVFDFPDFTIDNTEFDALVNVDINEGDKQSLWENKIRARFNRVSSGRYTITLGTASNFDSTTLKVNDIFNKQLVSFDIEDNNLNNLEPVNGAALENIPYIPNGQQVVRIQFHVDITES